jgi:hypothetical protein
MAREVSQVKRMIILSAAGTFVLLVLILDLNGFRSMHSRFAASLFTLLVYARNTY